MRPGWFPCQAPTESWSQSLLALCRCHGRSQRGLAREADAGTTTAVRRDEFNNASADANSGVESRNPHAPSPLANGRK
ncbi:hypothetical protein GCM10011504_49060 [Siccirubricoccus deserti]|nr:hypothetical protein GCM10011504_49060 [Siccirubricoccus deserti]